MTADSGRVNLDDLQKVAQAGTLRDWSRVVNVSVHALGAGYDTQHIAAFDPTTILALLAELRGHREAEQRVRGLCGPSAVGVTTYARVLAALDGTRGDG